MSRNVWHQCGGGWAGPTLFLAGPFQRGGSGMKVQGLVVLSNLSVFHRWSVQSAALLSLSSDELMSCWAVGTNGCRNLRCHAFPLGGQVSAEWSRCPGSMGQCAKTLRQSSAGWMPARIGRLSAGVGCRHPVTIRKGSLAAGSIRRLWDCDHCSTRQVRSTLRLNGPVVRWLFATLLLQHPSQSQQAASRVQRMMSAFCEVTQGVGSTWVCCPTLLWGIWARSKRAGFHCCDWFLAHV